MQEAVFSDSVLTRKAVYVQLAVSIGYVNTHNFKCSVAFYYLLKRQMMKKILRFKGQLKGCNNN